MLLVAIVLSLAAAFLHAGWNVLIKTGGDPLQATRRALGWAVVGLTPVAAAGWLIDGHRGLPRDAWALVGLSCCAELFYVVFLSQAYRRGEISTAYPVARGLAPLLALAAGLVLLGERLTTVQAAGVACVLAGIGAVAVAALRGGSRSALVPALLTGLFIAVYTTIDRVGVRLGSVLLYGWAIFAGTWLLVWAWEHLVQRRSDTDPEPARRSALIGLLMGTVYILVLFALSIAPLSIVAPLRESSIVLVAVWGVWRLRERGAAWWRIGGAGLTVAGAALIAAG